MFEIGATGKDAWPGISKLVEESGELLQVCGKLIASRGKIEHWDGSNLSDCMHDKMGDVLAALQFVAEHCGLDLSRIYERRDAKFARFNVWHNLQDVNQKAIEP